MDTATRRDMQNLLEWYKNRVAQRLMVCFPTKQEMRTMADHMYDRLATHMNELYQQQQQYVRQTALHTEAQIRRANSLETRLSVLEQELRGLHQAVFALAEQQKRLIDAVGNMPGLFRPLIQGATQPKTTFQYTNARA